MVSISYRTNTKNFWRAPSRPTSPIHKKPGQNYEKTTKNYPEDASIVDAPFLCRFFAPPAAFPVASLLRFLAAVAAGATVPAAPLLPVALEFPFAFTPFGSSPAAPESSTAI